MWCCYIERKKAHTEELNLFFVDSQMMKKTFFSFVEHEKFLFEIRAFLSHCIWLGEK